MKKIEKENKKNKNIRTEKPKKVTDQQYRIIIMDEIISLLKKEDKQILSFFTFKIPLEFYANAKTMPYLIQKVIKKFKFDCYIYCFEVLVANKELHCHLATSADFSRNFSTVKDFWFTTLCVSFNSELLSEYRVTACDYKPVSDDWEKIICYCCKQFFNVSSLKELEKIFNSLNPRICGGSALFSKVFLSYRNFKESFLNNLNKSVVVVNVENKKLSYKEEVFEVSKSAALDPYILYSKIKNNYLLDHPDISEDLIEDQFLFELHSYTDLLYTYNVDSFMNFLHSSKSSQAVYYVTLYKFLTSLFSEGNVLLSCRTILSDFFLSQKFTGLNVVNNVLCSFFDWNKTSQVVCLSDSALIYVLVNFCYILHKLQDVKKLLVVHRLALFVISKVKSQCSESDLSTVSRDENLTRMGHILLSFFTKVCNLHFVSYFTFHEDVMLISSESEMDDEEIDFSIEGDLKHHLSSFSFSFLFTPLAEDLLKKKFNDMKIFNLHHLSFVRPMIIPPRLWKPGAVAFIKKNISFYKANEIFSGGFLLNGFLIHRPLSKLNSKFTKHALFVSEPVLVYINKMQRQSFCFDNDLLSFYISNKLQLPGFLSDETETKFIRRLRSIKDQLSKLYQDKKNLKTQTDSNLLEVTTSISSLRSEQSDIRVKLDQNKLYSRLLRFAELFGKYSSFYFSYEFDFRMRLYCNPFELSFMGSKFIRSLIRFTSYHPFLVNNFAIYSTLQCISGRDLSEVEIIEFFNFKTKRLLSSSLTNLLQYLPQVREPFLFLACVFEYKRFLKSNYSDVFQSNFPIYLDCSANGPQLISLFFALEGFAHFLNLKPQTNTEVRGDFYSSIIYQFFTKDSWVLGVLRKDVSDVRLRSVISSSLRSTLKVCIMTQFYGVSYRTFGNHIRAGFLKINTELMSIFSITPDYYNKFINEFTAAFWSFLRSLPLFQLEELLHRFQQLSGNDKKIMSWSVFQINQICMFYEKFKKVQQDSNFLDKRTQYVLYNPLGVPSSKQRSAFLANFVHSLDAYILFRTCLDLDIELMPIHDSFGVHSCNVDLLKEKIKILFSSLVKDQAAARFFIEQLSQIIEESTDIYVREEFDNFIKENISFGSLTEQDVLRSFYYIYYS